MSTTRDTALEIFQMYHRDARLQYVNGVHEIGIQTCAKISDLSPENQMLEEALLVLGSDKPRIEGEFTYMAPWTNALEQNLRSCSIILKEVSAAIIR